METDWVIMIIAVLALFIDILFLVDVTEKSYLISLYTWIHTNLLLLTLVVVFGLLIVISYAVSSKNRK